MMIIEPCCAQKQFPMLRDAIGDNGKTLFEGYGDMSLTELLPAVLSRYVEIDMIIAAPTIPDQAADIIYEWMRRTWGRMDGKGRMNCLHQLTIIADLGDSASPKASQWVKNNPFPDRLVLVDKAQTDTVLLLPDLAVMGPLNFRYGEHFVCEATAIQGEVDTLWKRYTEVAKPTKRTARKQKDERKEESSDEPEAESATEPEAGSADEPKTEGATEPKAGSLPVNINEAKEDPSAAVFWSEQSEED